MHHEFEFQNSKIRAVVQDGELWFVAKDIAEALGYANPVQSASKIIVRNIDEFRDVQASTKLSTSGGEQEVTILNELGLYTFCMLAKTEKAIQFRNFVRQLVKEWRISVSGEGVPNLTTPLTEVEPAPPVATSIEDALIQAIQLIKDLRTRTNLLEERVSTLQQLKVEPLMPFQKSDVRAAVSERMSWLTRNGYASSFQKIYAALNRHFKVASYREIPSDRAQEALDFVKAWRPPGTPLMEQKSLF